MKATVHLEIPLLVLTPKMIILPSKNTLFTETVKTEFFGHFHLSLPVRETELTRLIVGVEEVVNCELFPLLDGDERGDDPNVLLPPPVTVWVAAVVDGAGGQVQVPNTTLLRSVSRVLEPSTQGLLRGVGGDDALQLAEDELIIGDGGNLGVGIVEVENLLLGRAE